MADRRHECPGRCGRTVPLHLLACGTCWRRLPDEQRRQVNLAYAQRDRDPLGHRQAVQAAIAWYRTQPEDGGSA